MKTMTWSRHSRRSVPIARSAMAFALGARTGVSTVSIPMQPIPRGSSLAALSAWLQREVDRLAAPRVRQRFAAQLPVLRPEPGVAFEARRMRAVSGSHSALA